MIFQRPFCCTVRWRTGQGVMDLANRYKLCKLNNWKVPTVGQTPWTTFTTCWWAQINGSSVKTYPGSGYGDGMEQVVSKVHAWIEIKKIKTLSQERWPKFKKKNKNYQDKFRKLLTKWLKRAGNWLVQENLLLSICPNKCASFQEIEKLMSSFNARSFFTCMAFLRKFILNFSVKCVKGYV